MSLMRRINCGLHWRLAKNPQGQSEDMEAKIQLAHDAIEHCKIKLQEHRDSPNDVAFGLLEAVTEHLQNLRAVQDMAGKPRVQGSVDGPGSNHRSATMQSVQSICDKMMAASADLNSVINGEIAGRIRRSRDDYKFTMAFVVAVCIVALLLMAGLLRFFYRWVFYPIRDLEAGVSRVAQGDFEHRIEVHSGDEIEDLANAFNDMTGRLRKCTRDLAQQVNERSRQLVRSERLAGVGFLAAGVAHEINNPLASIAFCSEALESRLDDLLRQLPTAPPTRNRRSSQVSEDDSGGSVSLQGNHRERLLAFSRGGERKRETTDLAELIQSVLDMVAALAQLQGQAAHLRAGTERITAAGSTARKIKQVFRVLNLVVNALDSMEEGGELTIVCEHGRHGGAASSRDTGCGMSQPKCWRTSSSRSSRAAEPARGLAWACRSAIASSRSTAARSRHEPRTRIKAARSSSVCRSRPATDALMEAAGRSAKLCAESEHCVSDQGGGVSGPSRKRQDGFSVSAISSGSNDRGRWSERRIR